MPGLLPRFKRLMQADSSTRVTSSFKRALSGPGVDTPGAPGLHQANAVGQAHPNQLLKVNLEQVKVHIIFAAGKYNVDPNYPLYKYSVYTPYWIFAKNNVDSHP